MQDGNWSKLTLAPALVSYLYAKLKVRGYLVRCAKPYNVYFGEHLLYALFIYHCRGLHKLGDKEGMPFYRAITNGSGEELNLHQARGWVLDFTNYDICKKPVGGVRICSELASSVSNTS